VSPRMRGFSAIEVLVAVAIVGGLTTSMMILSGTMSSALRHDKYDTAADALIQQIQNVLSQTGNPGAATSPCDDALKLGGGPPGGPVIFDYTQALGTQVPIGFVQGNNSIIAQLGKTLANGNLQIAKLYIRTPNPAFGEGGVCTPDGVNGGACSLVSRNGATYATVSAKVGVEFSSPDNSANSLAPRMADVVLMVRTDGTFQADFCYMNQPLQAVNKTCSSNPDITPGYNNCLPGQLDPKRSGDIHCTHTYKIIGFNATQAPVCSCEWSCSKPPQAGAKHWSNIGWYPPSHFPGIIACFAKGEWAHDGDSCQGTTPLCFINDAVGTLPTYPPTPCVPNTTVYPGAKMCETLQCS
jgi:prepilin-type N-terminal cleavage/methylation domain-containing protein